MTHAWQREMIRVGGLLVLFSCLLWSVHGQVLRQKPVLPVAPPAVPPVGPEKIRNAESNLPFSALHLIERSEYRRYLEVARDCIKDKAWQDACTALQTLLDNKEDFYVRLKERDPRTGRETERRTSMKYEANRLLSQMPEEGLEVYEQRFGGKAQHLLEAAKAKGDLEALAEVASRYRYTRAGAEADELLAIHLLDQGQFFMAALRFEQILERNRQRWPVSDRLLLEAVLAFRRAGQTEQAERAWKALQEHLEKTGGLKLGKEVVAQEQLERFLEQLPRSEVVGAYDWPLIRGNLSNSAQAKGSPPLLDQPLYRWRLAPGKGDMGGDFEDAERLQAVEQVNNHLRNLAQRLQKESQLTLVPGFFPLAVNGRILMRTYFGLSCFTLRELRDRNGELLAKAGELDWRADFDVSLGNLFHPHGKIDPGQIHSWLQFYASTSGGAGAYELLCENSKVGTLSTDRQRVYAVDDLAVPPPPMYQQFPPGAIVIGNGFPQLPPGVQNLAYNNSLRAYDVQTGKLVWEQGPLARQRSDFNTGLFLGPPLPLGGKLYALFEHHNGELELVCLNPQDGSLLGPRQPLGTVEQAEQAWHNLSRRIHAVHLAYAEGILVIPTHAGELLGVDLLSRTLAWAYPYRERSPEQEPPLGGVPPGMVFPGRPGLAPLSPQITRNWCNTPPILVEGKVVFTAPDARSVHCLNLRDGSLVWKRPQNEGDLFLAGVWNGKVVVVGKRGVRLLRLATGETLRFLPLHDMPAGQGMACHNVYYLPLRNGEICAIDLEQDALRGRNQPLSETATGGNLLFYEGVVLVQTPTEVLVYPQLQTRLELAEQAVQQHPDDLAKREERGELRLAAGQVASAVEDLYTVLHPPAGQTLPEGLRQRARDKLYLALTDLFRNQFDLASKYLDDYRELCKVPGKPEEEQRRQAQLLRLLAEGWEAQGRLVEAFQAYKEFGALSLYRGRTIPLSEDPSLQIPVTAWLRSRIASMLARASAEQRRPLEERIAAEWQQVLSRNDPAALRSFATMFDLSSAVGRQARLHLAESLLAHNERAAFLEAELNLLQLRKGPWKKDPDIGGRALELLARLELRRGTEESAQRAVAYLRQLAAEFPQVRFQGKTGAELVNDVATDKRLLPYLATGPARWPDAPLKVRELGPEASREFLQSRADLQSPWGKVVLMPRNTDPLLDTCRLVLHVSFPDNPSVSLLDVNDYRLRWTQSLGPGGLNNQTTYLTAFNNLYQQTYNNPAAHHNVPWRFFLACGHLAVFQVGVRAVAVDLSTGQKLWDYSLLEAPLAVTSSQLQAWDDPQRGDTYLIQTVPAAPFGGMQQQRVRVGRVAVVQPGYVALQLARSLVVLDPLQGLPLWSKADLASDMQVFGDEDYIYLVSSNLTGGSQVLRALDGMPVQVPDFAAVYAQRLHVEGRQLLAAETRGQTATVRRYDILEGKDLWRRTFTGDFAVLRTPTPALVGLLDRQSGQVLVLDGGSGQDLLQANALQGRITAEDLKNLSEPFLFADPDHIYVALNQPLDGRKVAGPVLSNFIYGLHWAPVNGWVLAFHRHDGQRQEKDRLLQWKKGDLHWHTCTPQYHRLMLLDYADRLPILLFSGRYQQPLAGGFNGLRWVAQTESFDKRNGKLLYASGEQLVNAVSPQFLALTCDPAEGTVNLIGLGGMVQHYADDGRKRPFQTGRMQPAVPPSLGVVEQAAVPGGFPAWQVQIPLQAGALVPVPPGGGVIVMPAPAPAPPLLPQRPQKR